MRQLQSIDSMLDAVAVVRGLSLRTRPPIALLDDAPYAVACADELRANIARIAGDGGWRGPNASLLPAPTQQCDKMLAFYDTNHDRVVIRRSTYDRRGHGLQIELLSHELEHAIVAHALPPPPAPHGVDQLIALHALEEGDASVTSAAFLPHLAGKPLRAAIPAVLASIAEREPKSLHDSTFFAYSLGARFVLELYARGGFLAVDDAFAHPPLSSARILHVERYLAPPAPAANVVTTLPLPSPFSPMLSDSRGELGLRDALGYCMPPGAAMALAAEWDADEFTASKPSSPVRQLFRWVVAWRSEAAAQRYSDVLGKCLWTIRTRVAQKGTITVAVTGLDDAAAQKYAGDVLADVLRSPQ